MAERTHLIIQQIKEKNSGKKVKWINGWDSSFFSTLNQIGKATGNKKGSFLPSITPH